MVKIIKKPDKKEVTTILGKDVHKIIEKYTDKKNIKIIEKNGNKHLVLNMYQISLYKLILNLIIHEF